LPHSFLVPQPSVQRHIDEHIGLIMATKTGMVTCLDTERFVSRLSTVYPLLRIVVTLLVMVFDVLSSEMLRLSKHMGVALEIMLLRADDAYKITPTLAGTQPLFSTGGFGDIAARLGGAAVVHMSMKSDSMSCYCRRSLPCGSRKTPLMSAVSCLQRAPSLRSSKSTWPQGRVMIKTR
jgi:hypothetical protein